MNQELAAMMTHKDVSDKGNQIGGETTQDITETNKQLLLNLFFTR